MRAVRILVTAPAYALCYGLLGLVCGVIEGALAAVHDAHTRGSDADFVS